MEPTTASDPTARKTLSPAEVHNVAFKKPPIGKRGYDEEEVDYFLDAVEAELTRLIEQNEELKQGSSSAAVDDTRPSGAGDQALIEENRRLTEALAGAGSGEGDASLREALAAAQQRAEQAEQRAEQAEQRVAEAAASSAGENAPDQHLQAVNLLALAQQTADQHLAGAHTEADKLVGDARAAAEQLHTQSTADAQRQVGDAQAAADALKRDSEAEAAKTVQDANDRAAATVQDAEKQAAKTVQDAEEHAATVTRALETRKLALERRVEELSTFEREYRSRLKSYLESQLRDLDLGATDEVENAQSPNAAAPVG